MWRSYMVSLQHCLSRRQELGTSLFGDTASAITARVRGCLGCTGTSVLLKNPYFSAKWWHLGRSPSKRNSGSMLFIRDLKKEPWTEGQEVWTFLTSLWFCYRHAAVAQEIHTCCLLQVRLEIFPSFRSIHHNPIIIMDKKQRLLGSRLFLY